MRRTLAALTAALALPVGGWPLWRAATRPGPPPPDAATLAHVDRVEIVRDDWGVPHVFGQTDPDAAFGLAWAHAEDDWPTIEAVIAASRGRLGLVRPGATSLRNDGYAAMIRIDAEVDRTWSALAPDTRALMEAYARGLNLYAWHHPEEAHPAILPITGPDVAAGFVHKLPLMLGLPDTLKALADGTERAVGDPVLPETTWPGSNAHAVAPWRTTDGLSRLNVNAHQPWTGPVSWYEAHVHSDEGWDMYGGLFPGAPMILLGHDDRHGWAMTVNHADTVDAYALVTDDAHPGQYRFDGAWRDFERIEAQLPLETPWGAIWIPKTFLRTVHGPVVETDGGLYAVRHSAEGKGAMAAQQWYRMNKATNHADFREAMAMQAIPMFNVVYADPEHIDFVFNVRLPVRTGDFDYTRVLPGDDPAAVWTDVHPLHELPQVTDPASGFLQACNSSPYVATLGEEPPQRPARGGIDAVITNRTRRTLELFADGALVDRERFEAIKWDHHLAADAPLRTIFLDHLPDDADPQLLAALRSWDGAWTGDSVGAGVATLAWGNFTDKTGTYPESGWTPGAGLAFAADFLDTHFDGRRDVRLDEIQRLSRGEVDLPLAGGPDTLHCTYTHPEGGRLVGDQGDSLVVLAEFGDDGARSWSTNVFGSSRRPDSPHFADQSPLFVQAHTKPVLRTREQLAAASQATYRPGEPWEPVLRPIEERLDRAEAVHGPAPRPRDLGRSATAELDEEPP